MTALAVILALLTLAVVVWLSLVHELRRLRRMNAGEVDAWLRKWGR